MEQKQALVLRNSEEQLRRNSAGTNYIIWGPRV